MYGLKKNAVTLHLDINPYTVSQKALTLMIFINQISDI